MDKYILWVDSVPNYFDNLIDAETQKIEWINKGYDLETLIIEKIKH